MANENVLKLKNFVDSKIMEMSALVQRSTIFSKMGKSFSGERDTYEALGYPKTVDYGDYDARYERGDIAKTIIEEPCRGVFQKTPKIEEVRVDGEGQGEDAGEKTPFENAWEEFKKKHSVWHYLRRIDVISGIGQYGVLFMGFDDGLDPSIELPDRNERSLLYLRPFAEENAKIIEYEDDPKNERYGKPRIYELTNVTRDNVAAAAVTRMSSIRVHHTRVLHIAEGLKEDDVFGTPRLKPLFNRLIDMDRIVGGSGEMFWRGAFPGLNFKIDPEADMGTLDLSDAKDQIEEYVHKLKRYLTLQGISVEGIDMQVASPKDHFTIQIQVISAVTRIPARKFLGSERGQLASGQDDENWNDYLDDRRRNYVEPFIIRRFLETMINKGVLPAPPAGFNITWPDLNAPNEKDKAETGKLKTETMKTYADSPSAEMVMPMNMFREKILEMTKDEIQAAEMEVEEQMQQEEEDRKQYEEEMRREEERRAREIPPSAEVPSSSRDALRDDGDRASPEPIQR
jgi:hypothetical protein